jgi:hypothetical protein
MVAIGGFTAVWLVGWLVVGEGQRGGASMLQYCCQSIRSPRLSSGLSVTNQFQPVVLIDCLSIEGSSSLTSIDAVCFVKEIVVVSVSSKTSLCVFCLFDSPILLIVIIHSLYSLQPTTNHANNGLFQYLYGLLDCGMFIGKLSLSPFTY